jgi:hypothetical protein
MHDVTRFKPAQENPSKNNNCCDKRCAGRAATTQGFLDCPNLSCQRVQVHKDLAKELNAHPRFLDDLATPYGGAHHDAAVDS